MGYLILTGKKKKSLFITEDYLEAYDFITKNTDAKVRLIDHNAKTYIQEKRSFLDDFLANTEDKNKFCDLVKIMVKGDTNQYNYVKLKGILNYYREYHKQINEIV